MDNTVVPFSDRQREADLALLLAAVSDLHPAAPSSSCLLQPTSVDMNADHGELQKIPGVAVPQADPGDLIPMPIRTFASTSTTPVAVAIDEDVALSLLIEDKVLAPMVREVAEIWPEWPITLPHDATSHPLPPPIPPPPPPQTRTRKDKRKRDGGVAADARALAAETRAHAESAALLDAKQRILALEMIQVPESELTPDAARRRRDRWRGWTLEIVPAEEAEGGREPSPTGSVLVDGVRRSRRRKTVMPEWVLWERPPKDREEVEVNREEPLPPVQPFQTSHKHPRLQAFGAAHPSPPRSDE